MLRHNFDEEYMLSIVELLLIEVFEAEGTVSVEELARSTGFAREEIVFALSELQINKIVGKDNRNDAYFYVR
jgi:hypothetical protein